MSQGEVINDLLNRDRAQIGLVDEDPRSSHHRRRDGMRIVDDGDFVQLRVDKGKHLFLLKPNLEECFLRSMKEANIPSALGESFQEVHRKLGAKRSQAHKLFSEELKKMDAQSRNRTFLNELEKLLTEVLRKA
jgi:hypothetical protein